MLYEVITLKKLEESGVIAKRVALLEPEKLGLSFTVFVLVKTSDHSHEWYQSFVEAVEDFPDRITSYNVCYTKLLRLGLNFIEIATT